MFCLVKWSWKFKIGYEPSIALVWVGLPKLAFSFCIPSYLKTTVLPSRKLLAFNFPMLTHTRPQYARVCIELDLLKTRENGVWIDLDSEESI